MAIDYRFAGGQRERLPALAAELAKARPDLLLGPLNVDVEALKAATSTIPIVMMYAWGPVEFGLVASLARPGGNVTGTTTNSFETAGKMTQVLRDAVPGMESLLWLADPDYPGVSLARGFAIEAGASMGVRVTFADVRTAADLGVALDGVRRNRPDAIAVATTGPLVEYARRIAEAAAQLGLPTLFSTSDPVRNGGLMGYGPDFPAVIGRTAAIVDKILTGTKPGDIPVEEPAKYHLLVNMRTARAIGLAIPPSLLLRADEVIQ